MEKIKIIDKTDYKFAEYEPKNHSNITVKEFIKALSKLDQDKEITIGTTEWPSNTITIEEFVDYYELWPYDDNGD